MRLTLYLAALLWCLCPPISAQTDSSAADSARAPLLPALQSPDSSAFYIPGPFYDREGSRIIIKRAHLKAMHAVTLGDALEKAPGLIFARNSFLGGLSDLKTPGRELYLDDKPVCVIVDGIETRKARADRVWLNRVSLEDVEFITVDRNDGGFGRGEVTVRVHTSDMHAVPAQTSIFWENGPFDMNVFKFSFARHLGSRTGLYVSTEKYYMFEDMGVFPNGPTRYSHPGQITDIYRAFAGRPDSLYVADGFRLEDDFRNWDVKLSTFALPGFLFCGGFESVNDYQDDYRSVPGTAGSSSILNFSAWQKSGRFYLRGRSLELGRLKVTGNVYSEKVRVNFLDSARGMGYRDTSSFMQGVDALGGRACAEYRDGAFQYTLALSAANDKIKGRTLSGNMERELLESGMAWTSGSGPWTFRLSGKNGFSRDIRTETSGRILLSPDLSVQAAWKGTLFCDAQYGCERRFPDYSLYYFDNPRLNYRAEKPRDARPVKSYRMASGLTLRPRTGLSLRYQAAEQFTESPVAFLTVRGDDNAIRGWGFTQDSVGHESRLSHTVSADWETEHVVCGLAMATTLFNCESRRFVSGFWTADADGTLTLRRAFLNGRMLGNASLFTRWRPAVWSPDFYILSDSGFDRPLNAFLTFDIELGFTIRTFTMFTRLQNLSNQVVSYEPGYHLPGPLIRWGIEWHFGN